jgi:hypothetical protein
VLQAGHVVVVPERPVTFGGIERTGWWRIDPDTGWIADEMDDGSGSMIERAAKELWTTVKASPAFHTLGRCVALVAMGVLGAWAGLGGLALAYAGGGGSGSLGGAMLAMAGGGGAAAGTVGYFFYCA